MLRLQRFAIFMLAAVVTVALPSAQQKSSGTGRIAGRVVTTDSSPQPVRRAIVTMRGSGVNGRSAITDDQGRFAFDDLAPGRFTLTTAKPAYLTMAYGATAPGRPGTAITITAGQSLTNLSLKLPRGAVISGTIRDYSGEPASTVRVAVRRLGAPAARTDAAAPEILTDDRGVYRAYGLMPGTYVVAALPRMLASNNGVNTITTAEVDALIRAQQLRAGSIATPTTPSNTSAAGRPHVYAPTFFPGTAVASDAGRITVQAGEDRAGVDFALDFATIATVDGTVSVNGPMPEFDISVVADGPQMSDILSGGPSVATRPGVNGSNAFKIERLTPGHYTILARSANTRTIRTESSSSVTRVDASTVPSLWGMAEIDVRNDDITGLVIHAQPAMTITGRVVFEPGSIPPPTTLASVLLSLWVDPETPGGMAAALSRATFGSSQNLPAARATVRPDGTFQIDGLVSARYRLTAEARSPIGWWARSAMLGNRDLLDAGIDIAPGNSLTDVVVTFSDRRTEVAGALMTASGQPAPEYLVAVFPADSALWSAGARRLKSARPAIDGQFSLADLPAGDYILAALTDAADDDWQTPATLQELIKTGVKITLGDGEKKTQNLQIGR